jgi:hypothetical protein
MTKTLGTTVLLSLLAPAIMSAYAQAPADESSVEARLLLLEQQTASLETRLDARTTFGAGSLASSDRGLEASRRIEALERRIDALSTDLRRIEQQSDAALRQASQAQRDARLAADLARNAASRLR